MKNLISTAVLIQVKYSKENRKKQGGQPGIEMFPDSLPVSGDR